MLIGEHGGDPMLAHIAMMQALQRHAPKPVSVKRWQRMSVIGEDRTPRVQRGIDAFDPERTPPRIYHRSSPMVWVTASFAEHGPLATWETLEELVCAAV
jgi:hypothetical protein